MSAADRAWLEQRLELHQRAIEAQLRTQYDKLLLAIATRQTAVGQTKAGEHEAKNIDILLENRTVDVSMDMAELNESEPVNTNYLDTAKSGGSLQSRKTATALHHLTLESTTSEIDPKSMRFRLITFLNSYMSGFINLCVLANTITMFVQLQYLGNQANASLGLAPPGGWPNAGMILSVFEYVFTIIFCVDLLLQIIAFRLHYFESSFNIMDALIVLVTSLEVFILTPLASSMGNVAVVRLLRLAKLTRAFKAARAFKSFEGLRVLVATMCFSFGSTFWSLVILFVFQVIGSIFMCQSLHDFVVDSSKDPATRAWVNAMYGDGIKSFWTIFELTFSGCWPNYARRIIEDVNPLYSLFYFFYVYIVVFVATRIVAALFMKETLAQYSNDADMMVKERTKKSTWIKQALYNVFDEADANSDGFLTTDELHDFLRHTKVQLWLKELGVDVSDQETFINLLDDGEDKVNRDTFVSGITRLRGEARSQDLFLLFNNVKRIDSHVKLLSKSIDRIAQDCNFSV